MIRISNSLMNWSFIIITFISALIIMFFNHSWITYPFIAAGIIVCIQNLSVLILHRSSLSNLSKSTLLVRSAIGVCLATIITISLGPEGHSWTFLPYLISVIFFSIFILVGGFLYSNQEVKEEIAGFWLISSCIVNENNNCKA